MNVVATEAFPGGYALLQFAVFLNATQACGTIVRLQQKYRLSIERPNDVFLPK